MNKLSTLNYHSINCLYECCESFFSAYCPSFVVTRSYTFALYPKTFGPVLKIDMFTGC